MKIAIIGNGPSREIYDRIDTQYDIVIGCNYPHHKVDYAVMVDAYAAKYLRKGASKHDELGKYKIVLGERAIAMLEGIKEVPGGTRSMAQWLLDDKYVTDIVPYPERFKGAQDSQKFLSSGHVAFMWATSEWPDAEIDMFGFDSLFVGDEALSHTREDLAGAEMPERIRRSGMTKCVQVWIEYWEELFYVNTFKQVTFWGYTGDQCFFPREWERVGTAYMDRTA